MAQQITGGQLLAKSLVEHDVDTIFGIPGIQLYALVDGLYDYQDRINFVAPRHEQSTTYMADGYARTTKKPGIAMVVPGPGVLNATAGLATALACSSPVLLICGQINSDLIDSKKYGALHEIPEQTQTLRGVTKWVGTARHASEIPDLVTQAFYHMTSGTPGPVALEIPPDVLEAFTDARESSRVVIPEARISDEQLSHIADAISQSRRPHIVAGGGAINSGAGKMLIALAEQLNCPIMQTRNGRGAVDASHPHAVDPYMRDLLIEDTDLVIVVGSRMGSGAGGHIDFGTENIISINTDIEHLGSPRPTVTHAVLSDARTATEQILEWMRVHCDSYTAAWDMNALGVAKREALERLESVQPQRDFLRSISETVAADTILVSEYTQVGYLSTIMYPTTVPGSFISPGYQGTLGYGFATAIGAQVGAQTIDAERFVVSISGDGGFSWTLPELATLKRYGIPLVAIVFNDGRYGNVYRSQKYHFQNRILGSELTNPDFMKLADAYGVRSASVASPEELRSQLVEVLEGPREPILIEVLVDELPSPWHLFDEPGQ
ncbi:MAG: thiamine pyrophosphate-binding protein [Leucobacter sp.]